MQRCGTVFNLNIVQSSHHFIFTGYSIRPTRPYLHYWKLLLTTIACKLYFYSGFKLKFNTSFFNARSSFVSSFHNQSQLYFSVHEIIHGSGIVKDVACPMTVTS